MQKTMQAEHYPIEFSSQGFATDSCFDLAVDCSSATKSWPFVSPVAESCAVRKHLLNTHSILSHSKLE